MDVNLHLNLLLHTLGCLWALRFDSVRNGSLLKCDTGHNLAVGGQRQSVTGCLSVISSHRATRRGLCMDTCLKCFMRKKGANPLPVSLNQNRITAQISEFILLLRFFYSFQHDINLNNVVYNCLGLS